MTLFEPDVQVDQEVLEDPGPCPICEYPNPMRFSRKITGCGRCQVVMPIERWRLLRAGLNQHATWVALMEGLTEALREGEWITLRHKREAGYVASLLTAEKMILNRGVSETPDAALLNLATFYDAGG